jgi:hypothetical protein
VCQFCLCCISPSFLFCYSPSSHASVPPGYELSCSFTPSVPKMKVSGSFPMSVQY